MCVLINLSDKVLTTNQLSVLSKGLNFVPTYEVDSFEVKTELFRFFRKIKLRYMFKDSKTQELSIPVFKKKSKFNPLCPNPSIQTFCRIVEGEILGKYKSNAPYSNISLNEKLAIQELSRDTDIIIKPADKGGAIVVQNMADYQKEAYRQLNDEEFYRRLHANPTADFQRKIKDVTDNALKMHWISKDEHCFLNCKHPVIPMFYMLPKIHKSLVSPKGRPIVASNDSLLEPLSNFVDHFIKPYVCKLPSYVKDSTDVINKISEITDLPADILLVTLDVESLYTNISHERGLDALGFYLQDHTDLPPSHFIIELASLVLLWVPLLLQITPIYMWVFFNTNLFCLI